MPKTEEEIKKFRAELLESLANAKIENVAWLQGVIFGLDWPTIEEKKDG